MRDQERIENEREEEKKKTKTKKKQLPILQQICATRSDSHGSLRHATNQLAGRHFHFNHQYSLVKIIETISIIVENKKRKKGKMLDDNGTQSDYS